MELRHLQYFVAVAETRHFGQAAERLHMAQSPLSHAIRQLEASVGAVLFERTTRRVDLTAAGEAFLHDARRILDAVDAARMRVDLVGSGHEGLLRVGATGLATLRHLPRLARVATRELPGVVLQFHPDLLTPDQELALAEDRIDVAVLRPPLRRQGLGSRLISRERLVLAADAEHPLAGAGSVPLAALRDQDFVLYSRPDSVVNAAVTHACLSAGFLPRRAHEAAEVSIVLTLVAAGLGVAVLPESVQALSVEGVRFLPIEDDVSVDLALAWRAGDPSPVLPRLVEALEADGFLVPPTPMTTSTPPGEPR
ncbi:LysR substrate-binding domain-containing protein [Trujillonella endophytica]|uniref:DNA-binding transcriptional regulator, LysR family n=1 Tax=Trujillonella endophytica TaxID=673521 RepID=A0A1H8QMR5_9ACTN|nr:LysR substrate-binding domain-containing protein [Trujillella endophytica]SEO55184.1 DNA-binding transcriptional regulator, LysR family [Trujillella endophytica]